MHWFFFVNNYSLGQFSIYKLLYSKYTEIIWSCMDGQRSGLFVQRARTELVITVYAEAQISGSQSLYAFSQEILKRTLTDFHNLVQSLITKGILNLHIIRQTVMQVFLCCSPDDYY